MGSFDDMMSSARGPGFIGMLLALLVLVGFGSLYLLVFDDNSGSGGKSIAAIIKDQDKQIGDDQAHIALLKKSLEDEPERRKIASELDGVSRETRLNKGNVEGQTELIKRITAEIEDVKGQFASYKQSYRNQVRAAAAGVTYPELATLSGAVYKDVTVTRVDAIGMNFRHTEGSSRADFENLPASVREQFQYDPAEKELAVKAERTKTEAHVEASNQATAMEDEKTRQENARLRAEKRAKDVAELTSLQAQVAQMNADIQATNKDWENEKQRVKIRGAGVVQGAQYETKLKDLGKRIASANSRISQLNSSLQN